MNIFYLHSDPKTCAQYHVDRLERADCLQQKALTGDLCFDIHTRIESLIDDIVSEIHALADNQGK